jgi:hypothetical protein
MIDILLKQMLKPKVKTIVFVLGPKYVAERIFHRGYRCVRRKTIVLCFNMEHIGTNKVKLTAKYGHGPPEDGFKGDRNM